MKFLTYNYDLTLDLNEIRLVQTTGFGSNFNQKINSPFRSINNTIKFDDYDITQFTEFDKLEDKSLVMDFINSTCLSFFFPRIKNIMWSSTDNTSIISGYFTSDGLVFKVDLYFNKSNTLSLVLYQSCLKPRDLFKKVS